MRKIKFIVVTSLFIFILSSCGSDKLEVTHYLLNSEQKYTIDATKKSLTDFTNLYPKDTRSGAQKLLESLQNDVHLQESEMKPEGFDVGTLSITSIEPKYDKLIMTLLSSVSVKNLQMIFEYDTGDIEKAKVIYVPSGYRIQFCIGLPTNAKRIRLRNFTSEKADYTFVKTSEVFTEITNQSSIKAKRLSNNTIWFNDKPGYYFITSEYDKILDEVHLSGKGSFVTANGFCKIIRVEVDYGK